MEQFRHAIIPGSSPLAPQPFVRVVLRDLRWGVVRPGDVLPESFHDRRDDAIRAARVVAALCGAEVVVYGLDGRPRDEE